MGSRLIQPDISNPLTWYDTHCHFDFAEFDEQRDELIAQLVKAQCGGLVVPGVSRESWAGLLALREQYPGFVHVALGLHPYFLEQHHQSDLEELDALLKVHRKHVVAIGEIGLDFYQQGLDSEYDRDRQVMFMNEQIHLAKTYKRPLILHCRKAHDETAKILRITKFTHGGIVHGFSGSLQQANAYRELGFVVGLGGALTHDKAKAMHKLVKSLASDQYVLETDAPDMRPAFALNEANTPLNLPRIITTIAQLRGESPLDVSQNSTANLYRVLPLTKPK